MQRIPRDQAMEYEFDHRHEPKLRVRQGESFVVETEDAASGYIRSADVTRSRPGPTPSAARYTSRVPSAAICSK